MPLRIACYATKPCIALDERASVEAPAMRRLGYLLLSSVLPTGCGGANNSGIHCKATGFGFNASPASDAVLQPNHAAAPPGNQEQFGAYAGALSGPGCAVPQIVSTVKAVWAVSDPQHVQISSANDATNGLATCTGTTTGAATSTATHTQYGFTETASAQITCK